MNSRDPAEKANARAALLVARLSSQVTAARKLRRVTQQGLAAEIGLTKSTIVRLESGATWTDLSVWVRVADALGIELDAVWRTSGRSVDIWQAEEGAVDRDAQRGGE